MKPRCSGAFFALVLFALALPCGTFFVPVSLLANATDSQSPAEEHEEREPISETTRERKSQEHHRREQAYPSAFDLLRSDAKVRVSERTPRRSLVGHRINEAVLAPIRC
ncbi:secreted protein [Rhodopirellula maiorica SM1]|uniref:Secreted protein n=1 Tax=Rhodopirellula maiorica SM1 TaxID=1265738 RepID=M5RZT2_9BACT|nr:hypothetical protein [Rhodopirellula maiorica]EMI19434.1 secreted protein [Rhodopirellula maiorica SM1]